MTWIGLDSTRTADDEAAHPTLYVVRENVADTAENRTQFAGRQWSSETNHRVPFSTPSDSWRTIPLFIPKGGYTDGLTFRIRYLLDAAATSGISSPTDAGDIRVVVDGIPSTTSTVTVTGLTTAEVSIDVDTEDSGRGLLFVELQFRSKRGSSAGLYNITDMTRNVLLIGTPAPSPTPTVASAPHLELDLPAVNDGLPIAHVCVAEAASGGSSFSYGLRIWPWIEDGDELPWGDGKTVTATAYNLPAWQVLGVSVEDTASGNLLPLVRPAGLQSGQAMVAGTARSLENSVQALFASRPNVYALGPALSTGVQAYYTGMRTGSSSKTVVGGAIMERPDREHGVAIYVAIAPRSGHVGAELTLTLTATQLGGGSATSSETSTATLGTSDNSTARRFFSDSGTLHTFNVADHQESKWSPADTGADGDIYRLDVVGGSIDYPGDVGDEHEVKVELTGADVLITAVLIHGLVRV